MDLEFAEIFNLVPSIVFQTSLRYICGLPAGESSGFCSRGGCEHMEQGVTAI